MNEAEDERYAVELEKEYDKKREKKKSIKQIAWDYVIITLASVIYAVGVSLFIDPNNLAPGGCDRHCDYFKPCSTSGNGNAYYVH